jgi:ABC-type lipopolysaccharide export system ATPase subunit
MVDPAGLRCVPAAGAAAIPDRGPALRRRTADAGDRTHADGQPALLLLDEPSEGLAPIIVQRIGELLRQLRGTGATVLIAEQNMHFCLGLASHATVIDKGQIAYTSTIEDLKANDNIRQRHLAL